MNHVPKNTEAQPDPIADKLDEMASLCEYWQKHRAEGKMPRAVRSALITIVREIKDLLDRQNLEKRRGRAKSSLA